MKLTKNRLRQIIAEEILKEQEQEVDPTKITSQMASTSQRKKDALDRISDTDKEFSGPEKGIVNQIEAYVSRLAALPGVDLVQHKAVLQRVLKMLETTIASKTKGEGK